jgi:MoaA/NifB/PqqE/SkfB family radical SAM enzyme
VTSSDVLREPTDFGEQEFPAGLVNVTNVCNLSCRHCFVFRADNPNEARDKMDDATLLHQLRVLRDKHRIRSMLFMGGEPMIRKDLVLEAMKLFESASIVTNGTYGIPSVPGHLVTVSLDGPEELNDPIRGQGVFQKVKQAIHERDPDDGTIVMLQMALTRENAPGLEAFVEEVKDWPVSGVAFTFHVPAAGESAPLAWDDLGERDLVIDRVIALKGKYPGVITLPLYMGEGGQFERPFCCYGNDVDCTRCGAYAVFNAANHRGRGKREPEPTV